MLQRTWLPLLILAFNISEPATYDIVLKPRSVNHVHAIKTMYAAVVYV